MYTLTNDKIKQYEFEINKFWGDLESNYTTYESYDLMMMTYEELCKKLPFSPFTIIKDKVYLDGEIQLPFKRALFVAIGETCEKYNNKYFLINYKL